MSSSATEQFNATAVVARAASLSHYARHLLAADPALAEAPWDQAFPAAHMNASLAGIDETDEAGLDRTLRKLRQAVMLRLIVRDLAGLADLQEVVTGATSLAEQALGAALRWHDRNLSRQ